MSIANKVTQLFVAIIRLLSYGVPVSVNEVEEC